MKIDNSIKEIKDSIQNRNFSKTCNGRIAVICLTPYEKNKATYGIQFWTDEMIEIGTSKNTDNSISTFIEKL